MTVLSLNIISYGVLDIIMLIILIFLIYTNSIASKEKSRVYALSIIITIFSSIFEITSYVSEQMGSSYRALNIISIILGFSISPCICISLSALIEDRTYKRLKYLLIPIIINSILFILSIANEMMFSVSKDNVYKRGPFYFFYVFVYIYSFIILLISSHTQSKEYAVKEKIYLSFLFIFLLSGTTLQVVIPTVHTSWPCVTLTLIMYYIFQRELQFRYDSLTNTLNRNVFEKDMKALKASDSTYLIIFDVDKFKNVNDTYGHATGDTYLKQTASVIKNCFKDIGSCYRIGGDEFGVIVLNTSEEIICGRLSQIKSKISKAQNSDEIVPGISYGYSSFNDSVKYDSLELFYKADSEMYKNKQKHHVTDSIE